MGRRSTAATGAAILTVASGIRVMLGVEIELLLASGLVLGGLLLLDVLVLGRFTVFTFFICNLFVGLSFALFVKETAGLQVRFNQVASVGGMRRRSTTATGATILAVASGIRVMLGVEIELLLASGLVLGGLLLLSILVLGWFAVFAIFIGDFLALAFASLVKETAGL